MNDLDDLIQFGCRLGTGGLLTCSLFLWGGVLERLVFVMFGRRRLRHEAQARGLFAVFSWVGAAAPLFGILGTVFGIMISFGKPSIEGPDTQQVLAGIAHALLSTGAGLFLAILALTARALFARPTMLSVQELRGRP